MSFVIRGAGVGEGDGDGTGDGLGVCASVLSGRLEAARLAAPSAGSSFTNERLLSEVFVFRLDSIGLSTGAFLRFTGPPTGSSNSPHWDHRPTSNSLRA